MNLIPFFETAVAVLNRNKSTELGDRTKYIGSSDVGSCARKVYLQKKDPTEPDFSTMLKFSRGHVAEILIDDMFTAAGVKHLYDTQVEVIHPNHPLKAHIDFLFYADFNGKPELHIVEVKSVNGIPDEPYPSWIDQLNFQLGLLRLKHPKGKLGGSILTIDLNAGQMHQFNGFEYNKTLFKYLCSRGLNMLDCMAEKAEPSTSTSFLCGYCSYRSDCPAMALPEVELPTEIEAKANKYVELNEIRYEADRKMRSIREELLAFTGPVFKGRSDTIDLVASTVGPSMVVDSPLLRKQYPDIYHEVLKERAGYTKLECKPNC
ncbi:MAG: hypothetical protein HXX11_14890 [Desulfuromonadales bacterium]|nr:hypothetical protein [Desulfuromonadales bacterium]